MWPYFMRDISLQSLSDLIIDCSLSLRSNVVAPTERLHMAFYKSSVRHIEKKIQDKFEKNQRDLSKKSKGFK